MKDYFDKYDDCTLAAPLTLEAANLKYRGVARIETDQVGMYHVFRSDGWLHDTLDNLEDAIEACRDLDNAEPADRQI